MRRGGGVHREGHVADLLHPHRPGWGHQHVVVLPVQHLLIHALQSHGFGDVGLVVVLPAVGVPGQRGCFGQGAEGRHGSGRRGGGCVGSGGRGAPASVRVTQDFAFAGAGPQS